MSVKIVQKRHTSSTGIHPDARWCAGGSDRSDSEVLHERLRDRIGKDQRPNVRDYRRYQRQVPIQPDRIGHQHGRNVSR